MRNLHIPSRSPVYNNNAMVATSHPEATIKALEIINKYQCIEDTLTRANHFSNVAVDSVDIFKDNIYKEKLVSLVSKSVSRIY